MFFCCGSSSDAYTVPLINIDPKESISIQPNRDDNEEEPLIRPTSKGLANARDSIFVHSKRVRRFSISSETFTFSEKDLEEINQTDINSNDSKQSLEIDEEKIKRALNKTGFLSGLEEVQLRTLLSRMKKVEIEADTDIIREGDLGDNFYVIESGVYEAWKTKCNLFRERSRAQSTYSINYENLDQMQQELECDPKDTDSKDSDHSADHLKVKTYSNEGAFGELTLMYNSPRAATIRSKTKGVLWSIDRNTFRKTIVLSRIQQLEKFRECLGSIDLFNDLGEEQRNRISESMKLYTFYDDEYVLKHGENGNTFHIILHGEVEDLNAENKVIRTLGKGEYFGERALIKMEPRSFSVRCVKMAEIAAMHRKDFKRLVCDNDNVMKKLEQKIESYSR